MPKQTVPDIAFGQFVIAEIPQYFENSKIKINKDYQRGDIWTSTQQIELIKSINNRYSIGVLVLFINEKDQFEILDGQQRLLTIKKYVNNELDLKDSNIEKYSELNLQDKSLLDAYCVYFLELKSHNLESKEEDIVQTFLRLQEGTPLNKAEKLNAHRGVFKDTFRQIRQEHKIFNYFGKAKRFRLRQVAAELLLLELEGDFENIVFPSLALKDIIDKGIRKYSKNINKKKLTFFKGNLDYLDNSLNIILTAFKYRDITSFYLLISYLRKKKANNQNLVNEFAVFAKIFLKKLNSFSIYDTQPPKELSPEEFQTYKSYKEASKVMTTPESIRKRLLIMIKEYKRLNAVVTKDPKRLHDIEQKRILYFRQQGTCLECGKPMHFKSTSSHHVISYSSGGKTDDLSQAQLLHERCHTKLEKKLLKKK